MVDECCIPGISWFGRSLFLFSFISYFFISFYCLFALVRTSSMMLNRSGEREYPCFAPKLKEKVSSFSPLNITLSVFFFFVDVLTSWGNSPVILLRSWMVVGFLSNAFSTLVDIWSYDFSLLASCYGVFQWFIFKSWSSLAYLEQINWSQCIILFILYWIWLADILWRLFHLCS